MIEPMHMLYLAEAIYGTVAGAILIYNGLEMHSLMKHHGIRSVTGVEISTRLLLAGLWPVIFAVWIILAAIVSRLGTKKGEG